VQDLPAIAAVAKPRGIAVMVDNSWATPLFYKPLTLGADIVVHAGTKMFIGHSDAMFGTASANAEWWPRLKRTHRLAGVMCLARRCLPRRTGLRTLAIRMKEQRERALELARWLESQPLVRQVLHPALESHPDHALFRKRDFTGSGSLFALVLEGQAAGGGGRHARRLRAVRHGLLMGRLREPLHPFHPERIRTATPWTTKGCMFRIHVGLEGIDDLKADMARWRYAAAQMAARGARTSRAAEQRRNREKGWRTMRPPSAVKSQLRDAKALRTA
jgi:cystathionine beta-lyase